MYTIDLIYQWCDLPHYGADEYINADELDNNCNGLVDEEGAPPCYPDCPNLDFIHIEGGTFDMGSEDGSTTEQPVHAVNIPSFELMRTEVTVAHYQTCVDAGVCSLPASGIQYNWGIDGREDHPINGVSWYQLNDFAHWVGARLPSEAEWEYAARSEGQDLSYPWGNDAPTTQYAVYNRQITSPVCSKVDGHTEQGLCDMAGNVWDWVQDEWHNNYLGAPTDGSAWCSTSECLGTPENPQSRVARGGSWTVVNAYLLPLKATFRDRISAANQVRNYGGRLARSLP